MNSEITSSTFAALPVRRRETLEIFDTALKLYRRYFWVLMGWSALIAVMSIIPILSSLTFFTMPLLFGAVSCCMAGAVRGQKVSFSQCWSFTKPRYGPLLGVVFLSYLVFIGAILIFYIAAILLGLLGYFVLSNAPEPVQIVGVVIGVLLGLVGFSTLGLMAFGWMNMVPIVACLEDDKRGTAALGRAFELLKGNWRRVFGISLILGLAVIAVFGIVGGAYSLIVGFASIREIFGDPSGNALLGLMGSLSVVLAAFILIWNPAQSLIIAVLYLDLRVRREALDLEWMAYSSAPTPDPNVELNRAPSAVSYPNTFSAPAPAFAPAPAPAEFDFLRPNAVASPPDSAPAPILSPAATTSPPAISVTSGFAPPVSLPNAPILSQSVTTEDAPVSFAPESAFAPTVASTVAGAPAAQNSLETSASKISPQTSEFSMSPPMSPLDEINPQKMNEPVAAFNLSAPFASDAAPSDVVPSDTAPGSDEAPRG